MTDTTMSGPADDRPETTNLDPVHPYMIRQRIPDPEGTSNPDPEDAGMRVQWVRPTDLAARAGAVTLEKSADLHRRSHQLVREAVAEATRSGRDRLQRLLARREQQLTSDTATTTAQRTLGRKGVSL
jgi:hypothetical protein